MNFFFCFVLFLLAIVLSVLLLLVTPLVSFGHYIVCHSSTYGFWLPLWYLLAIVLSVILHNTVSDYPFDIIWPLYCPSFGIRLLITPFISFGHCVVCHSSTYGFWLPLWYHLTIVLSVLLHTASNYSFHILWPLCCLSFFDIRLLITPLISFDHCIVRPSSAYGF